jgi:hypothetical protein
MYENQTLLYIVPLMAHTIVVCVNSITAMDIGCFNYQSDTHQLYVSQLTTQTPLKTVF